MLYSYNRSLTPQKVLGVGIGFSSVMCPLYVGTNAPPQYKGFLGALYQVSVTLFIVLSYLFGFALSTPYPNENAIKWAFRYMLGVGGLPGNEALSSEDVPLTVFIGIAMMIVALFASEPEKKVNVNDDFDSIRLGYRSTVRFNFCQE